MSSPERTHLPELEDLASDVARPPLHRDRPGGLARKAEEGDEEVGHAQVEDHGAEAGAVAVAEDGEDGGQVGQQREEGHHEQDGGAEDGLEVEKMNLDEPFICFCFRISLG